MARIEYLTAHPTKINQDYFGVCGMTSILYGLRKARPHRFEDLCVAAFCGTPFRLPNKEEVTIDLGNLLKYFKGGTGLNKDSYFVDYMASRALGQIMKTKNRPLYNKQKKEFNVHFDETTMVPSLKDYKNFTKEGNLALQTEALDWILSHVIGTTSCESFEDLTAETFPAFVAKVAVAKSFNVAGICIDLVQSAKHSHPSAGPSTAGSPYDHWIVIEKIATKGTDYEITYWTWAQEPRKVTVAIAHAHTYIRAAVCAVIAPK